MPPKLLLIRRLFPVVLILSTAAAENIPATSVPPEVARIIGTVADGTSPAPQPTPPPLECAVISSFNHQIAVEQASEVPGLPSVKRTINSTVKLVEDPRVGYPPPLPATDFSDPAVQARIAEFRQRHQGEVRPQIAFVSATWYVQEKVSKISWWFDGEQLSCVSRLNMMYFGGFGEFAVGERRYALIMGLGSEDTGRREQLFEAKGREYVRPEIPSIPEGQDFVVTQGDPANIAKMQLVADLHALAKAQGPAMETAYFAREQARKDREAYLKAHPPIPKDVVIQVWQRNQATDQNQEPRNEGGAR